MRPGLISLGRAVRLLSTGPRRILGLPGGDLKPGSPADLTLLDLEASAVVRPKSFRSLGRNTPFGGCELTGQPAGVFVGGRAILRG